jgi:hypothetical protein
MSRGNLYTISHSDDARTLVQVLNWLRAWASAGFYPCPVNT